MPTVIILLLIPRGIWRNSVSYLRRVMPVQFTGLENISNLYSTHWKGPNRIEPGESQIWFHGTRSNYVPGLSRILTPLDKIQRRADRLCENLPAISVAIDIDSTGTVSIQAMQSVLRWGIWPTVLLTGPSSRAQAIVAQREWPFEIRSTQTVSNAITVIIKKTYIAPLSVVGGASRSGFSSSMGTFSGPRIDAPSDGTPAAWRIGRGMMLDPGLHNALLGSLLAYGTVGVLEGAEEVV